MASTQVNSWVMYRRGCDGWDKENTLNVSEVEILYPDLRGQRRLNNEQNCVYTGINSVEKSDVHNFCIQESSLI